MPHNKIYFRKREYNSVNYEIIYFDVENVNLTHSSAK